MRFIVVLQTCLVAWSQARRARIADDSSDKQRRPSAHAGSNSIAYPLNTLASTLLLSRPIGFSQVGVPKATGASRSPAVSSAFGVDGLFPPHTTGIDEYGQGHFAWYRDFEHLMSVYGPGDRDGLFSEQFKMPTGVYEVKLKKPLGITFQEEDEGGIYVEEVLSQAEAAKMIMPGDRLIALAGCAKSGARIERKLVNVMDKPLTLVASIVASNDPTKRSIIFPVMFWRPADGDAGTVRKWLEWFEIPEGHTFRRMR